MATPVFRKRSIDRTNFTNKAAFINKVRGVIEAAAILYPSSNIGLKDIPIVFTNAGQSAGKCAARRIMGTIQYNLEFSTRHIEAGWDHCFNDTIPHEVAHIVDHLNRGKWDHGPAWQGITVRLGGTGTRCHSIETAPSRNRRPMAKHVYITTTGYEIELSTVRHNKLQRGTVGAYGAVGHGRILASGWAHA